MFYGYEILFMYVNMSNFYLSEKKNSRYKNNEKTSQTKHYYFSYKTKSTNLA